MLDAWLRARRPAGAGTERYIRTYAGLVRRELGEYALADFAPPEGTRRLISYVKSLERKGLSGRTIRCRLSVAEQALRLAVERCWIASPPLHPSLPPKAPPVFRWITESMFRALRCEVFRDAKPAQMYYVLGGKPERLPPLRRAASGVPVLALLHRGAPLRCRSRRLGLAVSRRWRLRPSQPQNVDAPHSVRDARAALSRFARPRAPAGPVLFSRRKVYRRPVARLLASDAKGRQGAGVPARRQPSIPSPELRPGDVSSRLQCAGSRRSHGPRGRTDADHHLHGNPRPEGRPRTRWLDAAAAAGPPSPTGMARVLQLHGGEVGK